MPLSSKKPIAWVFTLGVMVGMTGCRWLPVQPEDSTRETPPFASPMSTLGSVMASTRNSKPSVPKKTTPTPQADPKETQDRQTAATPGATPRTSLTTLLDAALARERAELERMTNSPMLEPPPPELVPPLDGDSALAVATSAAPGTEATSLSEPVSAAESPSSRVAEFDPSALVPPEPKPVSRPGPMFPGTWSQAEKRLRAAAREQELPEAEVLTNTPAGDRPTEPLPTPNSPSPIPATIADTPVTAPPVPDSSAVSLAPAPLIGVSAGEGLPPVPSAVPAPSGPVIADLALCRHVRGFADIEPIDAAAIRAGRPIILYCQMDGLRYESLPVGGDERFRSRLGSRVELVPDGATEPVWRQDFETAEDVCRRPRRDYYASYPLVLPAKLAAGTYRLRLIQTDLVADRSVDRTLTLTIRR